MKIIVDANIVFSGILNSITFISEEQISLENWKFSEKLVSNIDAKDVIYIAYSKQFKCKLWTGDKKLLNGLAKKNYYSILTTDDLFTIRNNRLIPFPSSIHKPGSSLRQD